MSGAQRRPAGEPHAAGGPVPRVLHVVGAMNVGGAETLLMNLYRKIDRSRVQFDFLIFGDGEGVFDREIQELGGRLLRLPLPRERGLRRSVRDVRRVLRTEGPFIAVHAHVLHASALALRAAALEGVEVRIAHSHSTGDVTGGLGRKLYTQWARSMIRRSATHAVACGEDAGRYLFGDHHPWQLLRNGVDLEVFTPASEERRAAARTALDCPEELMLLGAIARLEEVKNHSFLLDVAQRLDQRGVAFRMVFAGDGSLRDRLQEECGARGLQSRVRFLGLHRDVRGLMAGLDLLLMPSHYEGIPVVLMEAQASGLGSLVSTGVSREVDLGVDLVEFLPLEDPGVWVDRTLGRTRSRPHAEDLTERVRAAGAGIEDSVALLYRLYGLETQP